MRFCHFFLAAAGAVSLGAAAFAHSSHNALDEGQPIVSNWAATNAFDAVSAAGPDTVRFTTGKTWQVRAEGDSRTLERLRFLIEDGSLVVGRRSGEGKVRLTAATIYVTAPSIHAATLAGSGAFAVDRLSGEDVSATVAGSGDLTIGTLAARTLKGTVAGSGDLVVAGRINSARLTVAGSGRIVGSGLTADEASATIAGSGSAGFHSDGVVSAHISGSGNVDVTGRAACTQSRSGSGALRCGG